MLFVPHLSVAQFAGTLPAAVSSDGLGTALFPVGGGGGGGGGADAYTPSAKDVILVVVPETPVTVMVEVATGVALVLWMVIVVVQEGLQLPCVKEALAPAGSPDAENETDCVLPERSVPVIEFPID